MKEVKKMGKLEDNVRNIIKDLGEDEDFMEAVKENLDYADLIKEAVEDKEVKTSVAKAVKDAVKNIIEDEDNDTIQDAVNDNFDATDLVKESLQDPEVKNDITEVVKSAILKIIKDDNSDIIQDTAKDVLAKDESLSKIIQEELNYLLNDDKNTLRESIRKVLISVLNDDLSKNKNFLGKLSDCLVKRVADGLLKNLFSDSEKDPYRR